MYLYLEVYLKTNWRDTQLDGCRNYVRSSGVIFLMLEAQDGQKRLI